MDVQHLQPVGGCHLDHLGGQRQRVGILLEQRIFANLHLVKGDPRRQIDQTQRRRIADERDRVPAQGELLAQLGGEHPAAAMGGVTGDA